MKFMKLPNNLLITCVSLVCVVAFLKADYYKSDFFPIGITGINPTNKDYLNCPYGAVDIQPKWRWTPAESDNNEQDLIFDLGINCIGCQDAQPSYLANLDSNSSAPNWSNNYLHKVCMPSFETNDNIDSIFIITSGFYVDTCKVFMCCSDTVETDTGIIYLDSVPCYTTYNYGRIYDYDDGVEHRINWNHSAYYLFHNPYRKELAGYGSILFESKGSKWDDCDSCNWENPLIKYKEWGCHGTEVDNWNTFGGDTIWCWLCDRVVDKFGDYFDQWDTLDKYFWGFNLISEDPAMYRNTNTYLYRNKWHGCWAAADRYFRGKNSTGFSVKKDSLNYKWYAPTHEGIRGVTYNDGKDRMLIAKGATWPLHMMGYNIFEYLPEIDAIAVFEHTWCLANTNYGQQGVFDNFLYGSGMTWSNYRYLEKWGYHNTAVYFQQYGNTNSARPDQKRRWIAWFALEWNGVKAGGSGALSRRPCPPEIRCAAYLAMSRGCKGILFHGWTFSVDTSHTLYPNMQIPYALPKVDSYYVSDGNIGIRDHYGYPFGNTGSNDHDHHVLNTGVGSGAQTTYWHSAPGKYDSTYYYLCKLIPELKLITPTLMQLDWVNGYSLNSTDPNWASPCPHYYLKDVWGVEYADVGFFDHPYEPVGVEYFMLVNREGIADMTNRTVTVALDAGHWPDADSLTLTDIANKEHPKTLKRDGDRFVFTQVFEPGEGKLYRVAPVTEPPITMLHH